MKYLVIHKQKYTSSLAVEEFDSLPELTEAVLRGKFEPGFTINRRMSISIQDAQEAEFVSAATPVEKEMPF